MKKLDSSLLSIEVSSIALGYRALNVICETAQNKIRVVEASPVGDRFLILVIGEEGVLKLAQAKVKTDLEATHPTSPVEDSEIFSSVPLEVFDCIYSLQQVSLAESLLVGEFKSVTACISSAIHLVEGHDLKAIEIKIHRGGAKGAYGYFTGEDSKILPAAEDVRTRLKRTMREGWMEVISKPSTTVRSFFNMDGNG